MLLHGCDFMFEPVAKYSASINPTIKNAPPELALRMRIH